MSIPFDFETYDAKVEEYANKLRDVNCVGDEWDAIYEELSEYQAKVMGEYLEQYKANADTRAKEIIAELLEYAVRHSDTGSSVVCDLTQEEADEVDDIIWEEIGDFMLDYPEIYEDTHYGTGWNIDAMFGGNYVPYWDGWDD